MKKSLILVLFFLLNQMEGQTSPAYQNLMHNHNI